MERCTAPCVDAYYTRKTSPRGLANAKSAIPCIIREPHGRGIGNRVSTRAYMGGFAGFPAQAFW